MHRGRTESPGRGTEVGERDAGMVKQGCSCTVPDPVGGLGAEAVQTVDRQRKDHGELDACFFHKTTHFLALLPMHGVPDPEPSSPHISCIPHLTLQTHRNLGFLRSGEGLTAILEKG